MWIIYKLIMFTLITHILVLISLTQSRIFETSFKFDLLGKNKGWIFIDKMTIAPGSATAITELSVTGIPNGRGGDVFLQAIPESRWSEEVEKMCKNRIKMPLAIHELKLDGSITTTQYAFSVNDYQTHYFILKDCQSRFINDYNNTNMTMNIKLHILNNDRQIGEEEDHWYIIPLIIASGLILVYYYFQEYKAQNEVDWSKLLLFAGTVTQVSSLCWKSFGYLLYLYTGSDHSFFHFIYLLLHSTSQSAIITLIVLVGFGWTLNYTYGKQFDIFLPIVGCLGILNVIITMITKLGHSHDRHHIFDSIGGVVLISFRIVIAIVFIVGCISTYRKMRHNLRRFMWKFAILGFVYVASTPLIVLAANFLLNARSRHEFVFIAVEATKFITNLLLAYEFNAKASEYNRVNYRNSSFLPEEEKGFK